MTCREKLKIEHPDKVDPYVTGGCVNCPHHYGYMEKPKDCHSRTCDSCWDREIPETKPTFAIGSKPKPWTLTIENCETIALRQKEIDIEVTLDSNMLDSIDTIVINGRRFKKEN